MAYDTLVLTTADLVHLPGVRERAALAQHLKAIAPAAANADLVQEALEKTELRFSLMAA